MVMKLAAKFLAKLITIYTVEKIAADARPG
jgi:hypothetical protein